MKKNRNKTLESESRKGIVVLNLPILLFLLLISGCVSGKKTPSLQSKVEVLTSENAELKSQVEQLTTENEELKKRIVVLQDLPDDVKGINLYHLVSVKLQNYSGLFDDNNDGKLDTLIVRVQPVDSYGDIIKAAGSVQVELWNLNKPEDQALIGKWQVTVEELKKDWNEVLVTNYRLAFDISGKIDNFDEPLTIKMNFTDYLSGRVLQAQKVIEP